MLANSRLYAIIEAVDVDEAVAFYEGKLGFPVIERSELLPGHEEVLFDVNGAVLCVDGGGKPTESTKTAYALEVDDMRATVEEVRARGITFEEYDLPVIKTEDGVARVGPTEAAWFKDPTGNLVGLVSRPGETAR